MVRTLDRPYLMVDFQRAQKLTYQQPTAALVRQKEYQHDTVLLTYRDSGIGRRRYRRGQPVVVRWGWLPRDIETFYGYVHSSKLIQKRKGQAARLEVYLVGASYRLNKPRMRSFLRLNVVPLIRRIGSEHRFTMRNDPSTRFHRHIPQLGRTDWNVCVRLAKDIGFTFSARRTELQFKRRLLEVRPGVPVPTFRFAQGYGPTRGTLFEFMQRTGASPLASNMKRLVRGVDDNGRPFKSTFRENPRDKGDAPVFTEFITKEVATSIADANETISGLNGMNRFFVTASAVVSGFSRLRCGQTVAFTEAVDEATGRWWTGSVEHHLEGQRPGRPTTYRCHLELGRDSVLQVPVVSVDPVTGEPVAEEPALDPDRDDTSNDPEVPTIFNPDDDCSPIEQPPGRPERVMNKRRLEAPRLDRWTAQVSKARR